MSDRILTRAIRAYFRWARREGLIADQPSVTASFVSTRGIVHLRNIRGELARYRYARASDRLSRIAAPGAA